MNHRGRWIRQIPYRLLRLVEESINVALMAIAVVLHKMRKHDGEVRKVLLTRLDSIGDAILFSASLSAYRELYKTATIVLLVRERTSGIVDGCPFVDEVWKLNEKEFRRRFDHRWWWWKRMTEGDFDLVVNTVYSNSFPEFDCLIGWTGAKRRIAHSCLDIHGGRMRAWPFYTALAPSVDEWMFEIERNFDLLRYLGYRGREDHQTHVWTHSSGSVESEAQMSRIGTQPYAVLCPGSRVPEKMWASDHFISVVQQAHASSPMLWFLCGDKAEVPLCEQISETLSRSGIPVVSLAGRTSLSDLVMLIGKASLCLGNDSAPIHIAAATSTPAVGIVGGGHDGRFYPYPENPLTIAVVNRTPCYRCYWDCVLPETECITRIQVDPVVRAVLHALQLSNIPLEQTHADC